MSQAGGLADGHTARRRVGDLTEDALLALILPRMPVGSVSDVGAGDDAAVLRVRAGRMVVTTDVLVEGVHFRRYWSTGADVGVRAVNQNLADVAAMGAAPTAIVVALSLPGDLPLRWLDSLADGIAEASGRAEIGVVGGDLSSGDAVTVSVTAMGELAGRSPVRRSGAKPGDVVALVGSLGRAAAGLALLEAEHEGVRGLPDGRYAHTLVRSYLRPDPPLAAGVEASKAGARAMLDVSDGLIRDATRIADASGVTLALESDAVAQDVARLGSVAASLGVDPWDWVLGGGEDHGLLAVFPPRKPLPPDFRVIGAVRHRGVAPVLLDSQVAAMRGWDHFSG